MRQLPRIIKGQIAYLIRSASLLLPPRWGCLILNRSWPTRKPILDYLEFHLADHCNLNCAGCLHYAPFADTHFADINALRRDFNRLKTIFSNIRHIRIMGGEPLLHPNPAEVVRIVRDAFPKSNVRVVTNGLKLLDPKFKGRSEFLVALRKAGVGIDWTVYPPLVSRIPRMCDLCAEHGVNLRITRNSSFMARLLPNGGGAIKRSFRWCRRRLYCPLLDNGRIYPCAPARFAPYYNRAAGTKIYTEPGIDIHAANAREILLYLMNPSFTCSWCAEGCRTFPWKANARPEDWVK